MNTTDLTERDYSRQSHLIVNSKYAMTSNEINMVLVLLTAIDKKDEDFKDYIGILHNPKKQVDSSNTQNSKDNRIPLPLKVI